MSEYKKGDRETCPIVDKLCQSWHRRLSRPPERVLSAVSPSPVRSSRIKILRRRERTVLYLTLKTRYSPDPPIISTVRRSSLGGFSPPAKPPRPQRLIKIAQAYGRGLGELLLSLWTQIPTRRFSQTRPSARSRGFVGTSPFSDRELRGVYLRCRPLHPTVIFYRSFSFFIPYDNY